jgi:hypothetical protein
MGGQVSELAIGSYLSEYYINKLYKTKSPKASESVNVMLAFVSKGKNPEDKYIISAGGACDGFGSINITHQGKLNIKTSVNNSFPEKPIRIINSKKFILTTPQPMSSKITFIFVGKSINSWVSSKLLAGKYADNKGKIYVFKKDGTVTFPEKNYKYTVALNFDEPPLVDCLFVGDQAYNYKFKNDKLILNKMTGEEFEKISKTPSLVLTKH